MLSSKMKTSFNLNYLIALTEMGAVLSHYSTTGMFETGAVLEENIGGWGKAKKLTTFFSRRPQNTGQNYQINHSNLPKTPSV